MGNAPLLMSLAESGHKTSNEPSVTVILEDGSVCNDFLEEFSTAEQYLQQVNDP